MLLHRFVLLYSDVGEKYALLICLAVYTVPEKNAQQFNAFSCKRNMKFREFHFYFYA